MRSYALLALAVLSLLLPAPAVAAQAASAPGVELPVARPVVVVLELADVPITPVTVRIVERALAEADAARAECLLIVLDTPGGLVDSTRTIVKAILGSLTPVVVYVGPWGGRAASAGVFITLAADIAAMAPGTNIGAAHPVAVGGLPISPPNQPDEQAPPAGMEDKIVNDTVAWARSLARLRNRNVDWAESAVRESVSVPAGEALELGVVDLLADDVPDLLRQLDGRTVQRFDAEVTLRTAGAELRTVESWWGERVLAVISNPNIAFLLLILGFYGILFEIYSPGWGVAGTLGAVCLVLAFFGLAVLPVSSVGLLLVGLAFALFVAEAFVTSYGVLAIGGTVCLTLGGLMLVDSPAGFLRVSLDVVLPVAAATGVIAFFLVGAIVRAYRGHVQTGGEGLVGQQAVAENDFESDEAHWCGRVRVHGEIWSAESAAPVGAGQRVAIRGRRGLTLQADPVGSGGTS